VAEPGWLIPDLLPWVGQGTSLGIQAHTYWWWPFQVVALLCLFLGGLVHGDESHRTGRIIGVGSPSEYWRGRMRRSIKGLVLTLVYVGMIVGGTSCSSGGSPDDYVQEWLNRTNTQCGSPAAPSAQVRQVMLLAQQQGSPLANATLAWTACSEVVQQELERERYGDTIGN
jgi:hypothetical protein